MAISLGTGSCPVRPLVLAWRGSLRKMTFAARPTSTPSPLSSPSPSFLPPPVPFVVMDQKQLLYAVSIASDRDQGLRQQANDFLRDVLANADQHWPVSPPTVASFVLSSELGRPLAPRPTPARLGLVYLSLAARAVGHAAAVAAVLSGVSVELVV